MVMQRQLLKACAGYTDLNVVDPALDEISVRHAVLCQHGKLVG